MTARRHILFSCEGSRLVGTLDEAAGTCGLVIVTGGNETRAGAWNGQALFAARIAKAGWPVLRFDRRGVGDSEGENGEFRANGPDIAAAIAAFREACPQITRIVALGNCDGAAALMLAQGRGCDALILSNPWTIEDDEGDVLAPGVARDHYRRRLRDPAAIRRLLSGQVSPLKLGRSLLGLWRKPAREAPHGSLLDELVAGIEGFGGPVRFLVAERDRTGLTFLDRWAKDDARIRRCARATHSYIEPDAQEWLQAQTCEVLAAMRAEG